MSDKKQTIEEVAEINYPCFTKSTPFGSKYSFTPTKEREAFIKGSKWQEEIMYSKEEVVSILEYARKNFYDSGLKWHKEPSIDYTSEELLQTYQNEK